MAQLSQVYQRRWRENYLIIKRKLSRHHFVEYKTDSPPINSLTIVDVLKHLQRTQSNMSKRDLNSDRWSGKRARWPLDHSTTHFDFLFMVLIQHLWLSQWEYFQHVWLAIIIPLAQGIPAFRKKSWLCCPIGCPPCRGRNRQSLCDRLCRAVSFQAKIWNCDFIVISFL